MSPTSSKVAAPSARAANRPNRGSSSPCPHRSMMRPSSGRAKMRPNRASAQGDGSLPVDSDRKTTANRSCMIRMPIAVRPCRALVSPLSSSTLTAKTVLEKLSANASRAAVTRSSSANMARPTAPSRAKPAPNAAVVITMWIDAPAQTSGRSRFLILSLSPIVNRSSVTPRSAIASIVGPVSTPSRHSTKPATR